jgi:aspartate kinase
MADVHHHASHFRNYIDQHKVAIVCSARSTSTKELGTTSLLFRAASEALPKRRAKNGAVSGTMTPITRGILQRGQGSPPGSPLHRTPSVHRSPSPAICVPLAPMTPIQSDHTIPEFYATVDLIQREHMNAARASVRDPDILRELEADIEQDCEWLRSFLFAAQASMPPDLGKHIHDRRSGDRRDNPSLQGQHNRFGRKNGVQNHDCCPSRSGTVSSRVRSEYRIIVSLQGIDAEYVSLENIVTDVVDTDDFNDRTLDQDFYDRMATALRERVQQCSPRVPVITGWFPIALQLARPGADTGRLQVSLVPFQGRCSLKSAEGTPISFLPCCPLHCKRQNCKYGKKLTAYSQPTRGRCRLPVSFPSSPPRKPQS